MLISVVLFPRASSALFDPYLQCEHLVALDAKVSPLAMVSGLPILRAARQYFTGWLAEHLVAGLFGIVFPSLPPFIYLGNLGLL